MGLIVDVHAHVFPQTNAIGRLGERFKPLRERIRTWMRPLAGSLHEAQTWARYVPSPIRSRLDELSGLIPLPALLIESTPDDLKLAMDSAGVDRLLLIAHPPTVGNDFVFELCASDPRLFPAAYVAGGTSRPARALEEMARLGARALKIHPAADGEGPESPRYRALLKTASKLGLPVIIHTGCLSTHLVYKEPELGGAERYAPWFERFPDTPFILAHMNLHAPHVALDLGEEFANVYVDTSWQPTEIIGEAVRRLGAEKVMFGSDWPFVGNNIEVGLARVRDCLESGMIDERQSDLIKGENAAKLWGLK